MPPKPPNPPDFLAELLALRPYIEHILCDGSRDPHIRAAAKDHVQTVMRKVVQHLPSYVPHDDGLRPWVTRIAHNEKIDAQRNAIRHDELRAPFFARFRMLLWQAAHLLPPAYIRLGTLPQLESMPPAVVEYANPVPIGTDSSPHVHKKRNANNILAVSTTE